MNTVLLLLACLVVFMQPAMAQGGFAQPLSARIANYQMAVTLDTDAKTLAGSEKLIWRNTSTDTLRELQFHLYLNAFRNANTTFLKNSGRRGSTAEQPADGWGWVELTSMKSEDGQDLLRALEFIQPDDGNTADKTVARVRLGSPLLPGRTIRIDIVFTAQLPYIIARTGYVGNYFMVAQWFPKIGVYEHAGQRGALRGRWNCHQFHPTTEFYADFGVYDVDITVPRDYVVGATGRQVTERSGPGETKTISFHAEDVHDFAWTAAQTYTAVNDRWNDVAIRLLVQTYRLPLASRYLESAKTALAYLDRYVGPYPYPYLTIVDPAYNAESAGGMEYPTLITAGDFFGASRVTRSVELVTVHEFAHQYWYGMVASNEFEEAWLDEGMTQYYEGRIMDETYGASTSLMDAGGILIGDGAFNRFGYTSMRNPKVAPIATPAWMFVHGGYAALTYNKTSVVFATLDGMLGRAVIDSIMRTYFRRWRFRHPSENDLRTIFNDIAPALTGGRFGSDLNWFFDQVLHGTDICDYELTSIRNRRASAKADSEAHYDSRVIVSRLGEVIVPVDVLIRFNNGEESLEYWDGQGRTTEFTYSGTRQIVSAEVDPSRKLMLDVNFINNSKTTSPPVAPLRSIALQFLFWVQNLLTAIAALA